MPQVRATRDLLASADDVWGVLSEPYHLSDWWPGLAVVEPDRRGLAVGARWRVQSRGATLLRREGVEDTLVVTAADRRVRFAFELVRARTRAELILAPTGERRTNAELTVSGPLLLGFSRSLPKAALTRLYDLCQTDAAL